MTPPVAKATNGLPRQIDHPISALIGLRYINLALVKGASWGIGVPS